jgi:hypothetical protein
MDNDPNLLMSNSCMTKDHLDHVKNSDYSNLSYFNNSQHLGTNKSLHEITFKVTLCLISIFASLIGNLLVLYTMFVLPKLRQAFSPSVHFNAASLQTFSINKFSKRAASTTNMTNLNGSQTQILQYQNNIIQNEIVKAINTPKISSPRRYSSGFSSNINQNNLFPAPTVSYKKSVNLFILNLIICDLMIVFWCSWVLINKLYYSMLRKIIDQKYFCSL